MEARNVLPVLLALFGVALWTIPAEAQVQPKDRLITVTGEGLVRAVPDMAIVRFAVVTVDEDPEEARRRNAEAAREAMNAVRELGVPDRKLRMETLTLQPRREYDAERRRYEEVGFEAVRTVVVELEDLDALPRLITRVVQRGANRLDNVTYELRDRDAVRDEALRKAVLNARAKAALIASTLGEELGPVRRVDEQQFSFPRPMMEMGRMMVASADKAAEPEPAAFASGEIEVQVTVQTVFELR